MKTILLHKGSTPLRQQNSRHALYAKLRILLVTWELYPILFFAIFLRLYAIDSTTFVDDDAIVFRLARDFFVHGLLPITSNRASLGNLNPPLVVYLFMLPAAFSANPVWAEVMVGVLNAAAVVVTYFFTRRYYGRIAGTTAALFFATAVKALLYSRNIWPQNLLPLFTLLFMFALFRGVVERRNGWFVPAVVLFGVLYQLHGSALLLLIPFAVALLFAHKTIQRRDVVWAIVLILLLFAPYLYWEYLYRLNDVGIMVMSLLRNHVEVDTQALDTYRNFLSPYTHSLDVNDHFEVWPTNPASLLQRGILYSLKVPFTLEFECMWLLLGTSVFAILGAILVPQRAVWAETVAGHALGRWWAELCATPARQGLILLLCWQFGFLTLLRHSVIIYPHYFIIYLPGQFIMIGLFLGKLIRFIEGYRPDSGKLVRYGVYIFVATVTIFQLIGSSTALVDAMRGNFDPDPDPYRTGFNSISSMSNTLAEADQLAQKWHIHRIYFPVIYTTANPVRILAEQIKTPVTTFESQHCMLLPDPRVGPVIFIDDQSNSLIAEILSRYTHATIVARSMHPENPPFIIYLLTADAEPPLQPRTFTSNLQLLDGQAHMMPVPGTHLQRFLTRWRILASAAPATRTTYNFTFHMQLLKTGISSDFICRATTLWVGDQMVPYQNPPPGQSKSPTSISLQVFVNITSPSRYPLGPLTLTTYNTISSPLQRLKTSRGNDTITLPIR